MAGAELSLRLQAMILNWDAESITVNNTTRRAAEFSVHLTTGAPLGAVVMERGNLPGNPALFLWALREDAGLAALLIILIETDYSVPPSHDAHRSPGDIRGCRCRCLPDLIHQKRPRDV